MPESSSVLCQVSSGLNIGLARGAIGPQPGERGLVHLADRANTGLPIVRLTGDAATIAGSS
jgi:hypothetical protein